MKRISLSVRALAAAPCFSNVIEDQKAQIALLQKDLKAAQDLATTHKASLDTAASERDTARTELATAKTTIATVTGERDTARAELATAKTTISTQATEITGLKEKAVSVESKANRLLASMGHAALDLTSDPAGSIEGKVADNSPAGLITKYNSLTDVDARTKFFSENKSNMFSK